MNERKKERRGGGNNQQIILIFYHVTLDFALFQHDKSRFNMHWV